LIFVAIIFFNGSKSLTAAALAKSVRQQKNKVHTVANINKTCQLTQYFMPLPD